MGDQHSRLVVAVLALVGIAVSLSSTMILPLLPVFPRLLTTTPAVASWTVTSTLLAAAIGTPLSGRLGDMFGKRRIVLVSLIPFCLGSGLCALSPSIEWLIAGRSLQGLAAGVVPLAISLLRDVVPSDRLGGAIALTSSSMGIGAAVGLPVSAGIAELASWRTLFWAVLALGLVLIWLIARIVPRDANSPPTRFDAVGFVLLAVGVGSLVLAISKGGEWGVESERLWAAVALAAIFFPLWGWWELRADDPLVDLRSTIRSRVLLTNLASIAVGFSMFGQSLILTQLYQMPSSLGYGHGQSLLLTGLWMAPGGLSMLAVSPLGAALSRSRGTKVTLVVGAVVMAAGYCVGLLGMHSIPLIIAGTVVTNAGTGMAFGAMPALIMSGTPIRQTGSAIAVNALVRSIGTVIGAASVSAILAGWTVPLAGSVAPSLGAFHAAFIVGAGVAMLAAGLACAIPSEATSNSQSRSRLVAASSG